jgi:acyl carrier protein
MTTAEIQALVLEAVRNLNLARTPETQLDVSPEAPLFGPGSPLDSLGLVSLLIDVEEALGERGFEVTLSDARAISRSTSPFRSVPAFVGHIQNTLSSM